MRQLDDEIFRKIASNREWIRHPGVILALVKNPKVPLALTLPLVKHLTLRELRRRHAGPEPARGDSDDRAQAPHGKEALNPPRPTGLAARELLRPRLLPDAFFPIC